MDYQAYLLGYNPTTHDKPIEQRVPSFWRDGYLDDWWPCANSEAKPGDEFFLLRQGLAESMKGIVGHGIITSPPFVRKSDWDPQAVMVRFDALTPDSEPPTISFIQLQALPGDQHWSPQKSGIGIRPETLIALHELWDRSRPAQIESGPARRRQRLATFREKQLIFKLAVKEKWAGQCALSGLGEGFCEVAHIFDYAMCEKVFEQIDPENGLLLAGHLHRAFDRHLLAIRPNDGVAVWSHRVAAEDREQIGELRRVRRLSAPVTTWRGGSIDSSKSRDRGPALPREGAWTCPDERGAHRFFTRAGQPRPLTRAVAWRG